MRVEFLGLKRARLNMLGLDAKPSRVDVKNSWPLMRSHWPRNRNFWPSGLGNWDRGGIMKVPVGGDAG
jgi:hypothetical protein